MSSTPPPPRRRVQKPTLNPQLPPRLPPRILPPGIPSGVKPTRTTFRFKSLLPYFGLVFLLIGLWMMIPKGPPVTPAELETLVPVIVIDAGHGAHDNGATRNGLVEKQLTLDTALRIERLLQKRGFTVAMTRRDDTFLELFDRAQVANQYPRALFVSIHFNDSTTGSGDGVETFYASEKVVASSRSWFAKKVEAPPADNGAGFAQVVQNSIIARLGVTDRGIKGRALAVVRHTRCPAILVEGGFVNNSAEARKLRDPAYREKLATAIVDGISLYHRQRTMEAGETKAL